VPDDTPSQARKLRVTIVGHASPRWRGAANDADADQRNERLARQRADQVFLIVERLLRNRLGQDVVIEKNVTIAVGNDQPDLALTARGDGSREARADEHKARSSDDDYDRRVEVGIDLAVPREVKVGRSLPSEQAKTKEWSVTINRLRVVRAFAAGGGIEVVIRNRKTGKEVVATAKLYGTGGPRLNPFATEEETGTKRVWFNTTDEVAISEFEDTRIYVERWDLIVRHRREIFERLVPGTFALRAEDHGHHVASFRRGHKAQRLPALGKASHLERHRRLGRPGGNRRRFHAQTPLERGPAHRLPDRERPGSFRRPFASGRVRHHLVPPPDCVLTVGGASPLTQMCVAQATRHGQASVDRMGRPS